METATEGPGWRCLWPLACELGEGPIWDPRAGVVRFVDIERPAVHRFDPATGAHASWTPPCRIGAIALTAGSALVAATEHGFALIDPDSGGFAALDDPERHLPDNRFNDGKADRFGRFWAGTMDERKVDASGALYRLGHDRRWTKADDGYRIANGPTFSPDGTTLYHSDTLARTTYAFDLAADGQVAGKRVFARWPDGFGSPDGMTTDAEGYLWIAFWGAGCVRRVAPDGAIVAEFALPAANVSSVAFGGADLDRLFVTSARQLLDADELAAQPLAGALFEIVDPGVRGLPGGIFAG